MNCDQTSNTDIFAGDFIQSLFKIATVIFSRLYMLFKNCLISIRHITPCFQIKHPVYFSSPKSCKYKMARFGDTYMRISKTKRY